MTEDEELMEAANACTRELLQSFGLESCQPLQGRQGLEFVQEEKDARKPAPDRYRPAAGTMQGWSGFASLLNSDPGLGALWNPPSIPLIDAEQFKKWQQSKAPKEPRRDRKR